MKSVQWAAVGCAACIVAAVAPSVSAADATKTVTPATPSAPSGAPSSKPPSPSGATEEMKAAARAKDEAHRAEMRNEPKVDINNASKAEIAKVLMISEADAARIIGARPIRARTDIVTKAGLPEGVYQVVRSRIIINEPRKQKPASTK